MSQGLRHIQSRLIVKKVLKSLKVKMFGICKMLLECVAKKI